MRLPAQGKKHSSLIVALDKLTNGKNVVLDHARGTIPDLKTGKKTMVAAILICSVSTLRFTYCYVNSQVNWQ